MTISLSKLEFTQANFNNLIQELGNEKAENKRLLNETLFYQEKVLELQDKILNYYDMSPTLKLVKGGIQ